MPRIIKDSHGLSDVGRCRQQNEDGLGDFPPLGLYLVVDASGGRGDIAQSIITVIEEFFSQESALEEPSTYRATPSPDDANRLASAFELANHRLCDVIRGDRAMRGVGATGVALLAREDRVTIAHVGDCRCYRVRGAQIEQLTEDHSLLREYLKMRPITPQEIADFPHKNVVVRAFGFPWKEAVDTRVEQPQKGDVFLLCSDGLHAVMPAVEMGQVIREASDLRVACRRLIDEANARGGPDDITALLLRWPG